MADEADLANDLMGMELRHALDRIRQNSSKPAQIEKVKYCLECGDDIPEARQAMGYKYCVSCAEKSERRRALFADS